MTQASNPAAFGTVAAIANKACSATIASNLVGTNPIYYHDSEVDTKQPLKIYSISKILSVKPTEDGFIETKVVLSGSISNQDWENFVVDGWPIYAGKEEWLFISKNTPIYEKNNNIHYEDRSRLTIKTKNGLILNQNFAFLNQQDTNHFTNEDIIKAVDEFNETITFNNWNFAINSGNLKLNDWIDYGGSTLGTATSSPYFTPSHTTTSSTLKFTTKSSSDSLIDNTAYYKGYELATMNEVDSLTGTLDTIGLNQDIIHADLAACLSRVSTLENKLDILDTVVEDLTKKDI